MTLGLSSLFASVALQSACDDSPTTAPPPKTATTAQASTISCLGADDCGTGQDCVCDAGGCACGVAADSTCDQCQGDGDCGDGQCCYQGSCIAANDSCACGQVAFTASGSDSAGCPDQHELIVEAEGEARSQCPSACGGSGDGSSCGSGSDSCDCSDSFPSESVDCQEHTETEDTGSGEYCGSGSGSGGSGCTGSGSGTTTITYATMVATVCSLCQGPPQPGDPCADIKAQVNAKQVEITGIQRDISLLTSELVANAAARDSYQSELNALAGLEGRLISGQFGDNIFVTTAAHSTSIVTDVIAVGKAAKFANGVACTGTKVCNILRVNAQRGFTMSVTHTLKSDVTAKAVYTPAYDMISAKVAGAAASNCAPPDPNGGGWTDWVPLYKDFTWGIGCYSAADRIAEVAENRQHATNSRNFYRDKVIALQAQIDQKNQDLGAAKAALAALQAQLDQCTGACQQNQRCAQLQTLIGLWNDVLAAYNCGAVPQGDPAQCAAAAAQRDAYQQESDQNCGGGGSGSGGGGGGSGGSGSGGSGSGGSGSGGSGSP